MTDIAIYQYDKFGYATGADKVQDIRSPIPPGWTHKAPSGAQGERFVGNVWQVVPAPPEPVPRFVSRRQARQQLLADGLMSQLESAIDGIADETQREMTRIWYQDADPWERDNSELKTLAEQLELSDEQVDTMFREASKR